MLPWRRQSSPIVAGVETCHRSSLTSAPRVIRPFVFCKRGEHLFGRLLLTDAEQLREVDKQEDDRRHRVADDDPTVRLEPVVDVHVVADVEVAGDLEFAVDADAFPEIGVFTDEDVVGDGTPHVESAVAFGFDVAAELDAFARHDRVAPDPEVNRALTADDDVAVGHEIVFLDGGPVGDGHSVEWVGTESHSHISAFRCLKPSWWG